MLKYQLKDYHLTLLQTFWQSDMCYQVKSGTKHDTPNQSYQKLTVALDFEPIKNILK